MKILDLFCCAGGASAGIHRAFPKAEIVGVDINPQPHYPFTFVQGSWNSVSPEDFEFIWASPPCQHYCALKTMLNRRSHPDLVGPVRNWLKKSGKPWVIENVFGAPLKNATMLCGSHFNLTAYGYQLRRHRYFEASFPIESPGECKHTDKTQGIYGAKVRDIALEKKHYAKPKATRGKPIGVVLPHKYGFEAMQIDWMNIRELSECIPPAYSEYVLNQFKKSLGSQVYNSQT